VGIHQRPVFDELDFLAAPHPARQFGSGIQESGPPSAPQDLNRRTHRTVTGSRSARRAACCRVSRIRASGPWLRDSYKASTGPHGEKQYRAISGPGTIQKQSDDLHSFGQSERLRSEAANSFGEERRHR
jgi:hypothetical protein